MKFDYQQFTSKMKPQGLAILSLAVVIVISLGICLLHRHAEMVAENASGSNVLPTVACATVTREDLFRKITIPAEFRPYVEANLNAKVSGYVDKVNVDFGDKVKAGQVLATLIVPELSQELTNAIAAEEKADADYTNAELIYTRLSTVNQQHPDLVAQQSIDTASANAQMADAAIAAAQADVGKYQALVAYTVITAPFDGVVTWRYADPGALIQAGTSSDSQSLPLVRVSDNYLLRLDFPVSVDDVQYLRVGDPVDVKIESLGKTFTEKITRFTDKVDEDTRTMMVEVQVPNKGLEIIPGMYATIVLKADEHPDALAVPIEAVSNGKQSSVLVVDPNNKVEARPVTLGLETPDKYEILSGLTEGERVMVGNPSHIQPGQKVDVLATGAPGEL
jgi:RND family efflux transporter MFP subunit